MVLHISPGWHAFGNFSCIQRSFNGGVSMETENIPLSPDPGNAGEGTKEQQRGFGFARTLFLFLKQSWSFPQRRVLVMFLNSCCIILNY